VCSASLRETRPGCRERAPGNHTGPGTLKHADLLCRAADTCVHEIECLLRRASSSSAIWRLRSRLTG
jgi:hypothetical protein